MTLTRSAPMRPCGKRWDTELEARLSKRGQMPGARFEPCWVPGCGGVHIRFGPTAPGTSLPLGTGDDPDEATRLMAYNRDGWACVCCGTSIIGQLHSLGHRNRRSQGGGHKVFNLLTFLGLGTGLTGKDDHHYRIDQRADPLDEERGYTVRSRKNPLLVPVRIVRPGGEICWCWLTPDGAYSTIRPQDGAA